MKSLVTALSLVPLLCAAAGGSIGSGTTISDGGIAGDFKYYQPKWVDALAGGTSVALGSSAPTLRNVTGSWVSGVEAQGYAYAVGDYGSFSIQSLHVCASTNAEFPRFFYEPHVHVSPQAIGPTATNVTFVMQWQTAEVFDSFTNMTTEIRTNTIGFTNSAQHALLSFGNVTNNALQGKSSIVFRGTIRRIASASNDVGATTAQEPFVDSIDFHIPTRVFGSRTQYKDE